MSPSPSPSDGALARRAVAGDRDAAEELFRRHWEHCWRAAYALRGRREDADDAAQSGFERAFAALDRYDARRPFRPWVRTMVLRQCIDQRRRRARERAAGDDLEAVAYEDSPHLFGPRDPLGRALRALPDDRRQVLALRYWMDMEVPEIAEALGIPLGTASSRLARAMADLRAALATEVTDGHV